jgi:acetyl-CoA carboxylase biotin carboxylase subunit
MEMNTRIQVEHPVTELIYGVDLVKEQIRIAAGEHLGFSQEDLHPHGHAVEVRVNAEDPENNFAPAAGTLTAVVFPGGPGIRVDTHVYSGAMVPPFYDSMLAKIIAVGRTRESAILRMERALGETRIEGVKTTVDFCRELLGDPEFRAGGIGVGWLPAFLNRRAAAV